MQAKAPFEDSAASFRVAMRQLAATVSIVSTSLNGRRFGMTATAVASVSVAPPAILVCINRDASIHGPIREKGLFCINVLHEGHEKFCAAFGGGRDGEERFQVGEWENGESGTPMLADAQANLLCRVEKECEFATHTIFVGRVLETRLNPHACPLVYLNGGFASVTQHPGEATCKS